MPAKLNDGIRVGKSGVSGKGLFATKKFKRGDTICHYTGTLYPRADVPVRNRYLVEVNGHWTLDGSSMSNLGRWVNHSCKPNATFVTNGKNKVYYRARHAIYPGDEIFVNYGPDYCEAFMKTCKCPACTRSMGSPHTHGQKEIE